MTRKSQFGAALAGLLALGVAWWWLESNTRPPASTSPAPAVPAVGGANISNQPPVIVPPAGAAMVDSSASSSGEVDSVNASSAPSVGDILAEPDDDYVRVAKKLTAITLDARLPAAEREEALAHAINLSAGNEAEVLTPLVENPSLPDEFAETILAEALNRPLSYQAELYLAALAVRKNPEINAKIREHLAFLTSGEDMGSDPAKWKEPLKAARAEWGE